MDKYFINGMNDYLAHIRIEKVKKSLDLSQNVLKQYPDNYETLWRAERAAGYYCECALGLQVEGWEDICLEWGKKGETYALKAQMINPDRVEAYFWQIYCTGKYGQATNVFTAIKERIHIKLEECMLKACEKNKSYLDYYPVISIALFYFRLPWPLRDMDKAVKYYKEYILNAKKPWSINYRNVECAELLLSMEKAGQARKAKKLLSAALDENNLPKYYRNKAIKLLKEID